MQPCIKSETGKMLRKIGTHCRSNTGTDQLQIRRAMYFRVSNNESFLVHTAGKIILTLNTRIHLANRAK
jgi:hypothetical protein